METPHHRLSGYFHVPLSTRENARCPFFVLPEPRYSFFHSDTAMSGCWSLSFLPVYRRKRPHHPSDRLSVPYPPRNPQPASCPCHVPLRYGISQIAQFFQGVNQPDIVTLMQSDTGFIQNIQHIHQLRTNLRGQTNTLAFSSRKCD